MDLEKYLQKYYGLKGNLYRKNPYYEGASTIPHWWTKAGEEAYTRFVLSLYDIKELIQEIGLSEYNPINYNKLYDLVQHTDEYEYEDPGI